MNFDAFYKVTYGLYVIGSGYEDKLSGYIANTAFQVTANPPRFAISCSKDNFSVEVIRKSGAFSISVLKKSASTELIGRFGYTSGANTDKFSTTKFITAATGSPIVTEGCIAWFDCRVEQEIALDTHVIFIGKMLENGIIDSDDDDPLTYAYYRDEKKGVAPKNAPTYLAKKDEENEEAVEGISAKDNAVYYCDVCGYEYNPDEGDPDSGIPPGTPFEDLPDDWYCPICGAGKEDFSRK